MTSAWTAKPFCSICLATLRQFCFSNLPKTNFKIGYNKYRSLKIGPKDVIIVQISHRLSSFCIKTMVYTYSRAKQTRTVSDT